MTRDERYFDWAATAPALPGLTSTVAKTVDDHWANPSSSHACGLEARRLLEEARERIARCLCVKPSSVVFTSGTTEGNNLVAHSFATRRGEGAFMVDAYAHEALAAPLSSLESLGYGKRVLKPWGLSSPAYMASTIDSRTRLVAVTHVASETGEVAPLASLINAVRAAETKRHIHVHVDAAQSAYRLEEAVDAGADTIAFGTHKFGAPGGSGILICNRTVNLPWRGGPQEGGRRPGTVNLHGALLAAGAIESVMSPDTASRVEELGRLLCERLLACKGARLVPETRAQQGVGKPPDGVNAGAAPGAAVEYSPHLVAVAFPPVPGSVLARALSAAGFMASAGTACGGGEKSVPRLVARGVPRTSAEAMIRLSIGPRSTTRGIEALCSAMEAAVVSLRNTYGDGSTGDL